MAPSVNRRRFVRVLGSGTVVGLAGCLGDDGEGGDPGQDDDHSHGGDEHSHGNGHHSHGGGDSEGLAYAFAPNTIAILDPEAGEVVDEFDGIDGGDWGSPVITHDHRQIFALESTRSQALVIDTETRSIVSEVDIGSGATHIFHPNEEEVWAHADDEGTFYVIDTESHEVRAIVEAGLEGEGHGKLLYHEDFGSKGYATNVNDPAALIIDVESYERTGFVDLGEEGGTHYKAYAPQSGLAYFERSGGVGTTPVVDVETDELVDELEFTGGLYLSPDEEVLGVLDGNEIHFIDATSRDSDVLGTVEVDGGPDALEYHVADGTLYGFTANTMTPDASVIDVDALEEVDRLDAGDIERPEGAHHLHRDGTSGGGYFFTPAGADGTVAVIDMAARELVAQVPVESGVNRVQYVGE